MRPSCPASLASLVTACFALGCGGVAEPTPTLAAGERTDELSYVGTERVVPLRFVLLQAGAASPDNVTWPNIAGSVQVTNQAFRNVGVQFQVGSVERFDTLTSLASTGAEPCDELTRVKWSSVKADLAVMFPSISTYAAGDLPLGTREETVGEWLYYAATRFSPKEQLVGIVLACGDGYAGATPWRGRVASGDGRVMGDWWKFTHEMGHVFGIMHSDGDDGSPWGLANANQVCLPSATATCNHVTGAGMTTLADFWDMVYLPGDATHPHQTFDSRSAANAVGASNLRWIDDGIPGEVLSRCVVTRTGNQRVVCTLPGAGGYAETWDTDDPATAAKLRG